MFGRSFSSQRPTAEADDAMVLRPRAKSTKISHKFVIWPSRGFFRKLFLVDALSNVLLHYLYKCSNSLKKKSVFFTSKYFETDPSGVGSKYRMLS